MTLKKWRFHARSTVLVPLKKINYFGKNTCMETRTILLIDEWPHAFHEAKKKMRVKFDMVILISRFGCIVLLFSFLLEGLCIYTITYCYTH